MKPRGTIPKEAGQASLVCSSMVWLTHKHNAVYVIKDGCQALTHGAVTWDRMKTICEWNKMEMQTRWKCKQDVNENKMDKSMISL